MYVLVIVDKIKKNYEWIIVIDIFGEIEID